jgi:hypothetical protein
VPWWSSLRHGTGRAQDVRRGAQLGLPTAVLDIDQRDLHLFGGGPLIAVRFGSADYVSPYESRWHNALGKRIASRRAGQLRMR